MENKTVRAIRERRMIFNELKKSNRNKLENEINSSNIQNNVPTKEIDFEEFFADDSIPRCSNRWKRYKAKILIFFYINKNYIKKTPRRKGAFLLT